MTDTYDSILRVCLVGAQNIGKTALVERYTKNESTALQTCAPTIGVDFAIKIVCPSTTPEIVKLQIWDLAGMERFRNIVRGYLRSQHSILFCFSLGSAESLRALTTEWIPLADQENTRLATKRYLVGLQSDLPSSKREVTSALAMSFLAAHPSLRGYFEASAVTGEGAAALFETVADEGDGEHMQQQGEVQQRRKKEKEERCLLKQKGFFPSFGEIAKALFGA